MTGLSGLPNKPFTPKQTGHALLIIPRINDMTANTINTWTNPPTLYTKTPKSQPMIKMTAIK